MRTITTTVYKYEELPTEEAKEAARNWYRDQVFQESCDWDFVFEDVVRVAEILGIEISTHAVKLYGGGTRQEPDIFFSGFWSQGDGASFEGTYRYAKGAAKKIREYAPSDKELHRIADELQAVQRSHFYHLVASCRNKDRYCHSGFMDVSVEYDGDADRDISEAEAEVRYLLREFADWIYDQLRKAYEFQTRDSEIEDMLIANEYEFDGDGNLI